MNIFYTGKIELSIVILCYRAGESARDFVKKTIQELEVNNIKNYELMLVGNYLKDSHDITPIVVADIASNDSRIRYIAKVKEGMMGWDMKSGLEIASGQYIAVIDGDGQMPIGDIAKVYKKIKDEKFDLVKTFRIKRGDSVWRKCISAVYNNIFHILFPGLHTKDINAKPKIFTRQAYEKFHLTSDDWFIDAEIMIQARRLNLKIGEIPTVFLGLTGRRSFIKMGTVFEFLRNMIRYRINEFKK
ncbi:MAG: Glycosyl transferase family 2 [Parcubacteria group bacterium GW2011_GWA2_38_13]|nr:MAG: Glycosyl transferase family 2 [Parcubacteria group bacterium GW2011_GWA2_38_13]